MSWFEANHHYLDEALARLRARLEAAARARVEGEERGKKSTAPELPPEPSLAPFAETEPPALLQVASLFGLSHFERDLLLLTAGMEIDPDFGPLCAAAQGDPDRPYPTFALAAAVLPEAHWGALMPGAPLRRWHLLEVGSGPGLVASRLTIEERVLHDLRGLDTLDERLAGIASHLAPPDLLVPSHHRLVEALSQAWVAGAPGGWNADQGAVPLLTGSRGASDTAAKQAVAAAAAAGLGLRTLVLPAALLPIGPGELEAFTRLLGRECALGRRAVLLDCDEGAPATAEGTGQAARSQAHRGDVAARFAEAFRGPLVVAVPERRRLGRRRIVPFEVRRPEAEEQALLWRSLLGAGETDSGAGADSGAGEAGSRTGADAELDVETASASAAWAARLAAQFDLGADAILDAAAAALNRAGGEPEEDPTSLPAALWEACRAQARPEIESLAQRIHPVATWDDLVLPALEKGLLGEILLHVHWRSRVHEEWGFAERSSRGLGLAALFVGPSGTGKTMAAEVLARELELDLYRIDLASVVSKYIGETEKNLKQVFDAAETGGAILLFDEADALFGKRSEVKDSHDRYANIEVGYLLQRMEEYRGLAILTTNLKDSLDPAFLRRLRFVVRFPFPDAALREEIWRRVFPSETPTAGLDWKHLARLGLAGGNIKNIALAAAFLAAAEGGPVTMAHVFSAARGEYAKLEKPWIDRGLGGLL